MSDDGLGLEGKVAIVTGAAQGIGRCIAEAFLKDGAAVMLADIQERKVKGVAGHLQQAGGQVGWAQVDVGVPESAGALIEQTLDQFSRVDVLVNNAGIDAPPGLAWEEAPEHWQRIIDVDLSGAWWCSRAVIPHMCERRTGRIIFISSVSARIPQPHISVAYNAAKAGLLGLTVGLSLQLEAYGVLVNAIVPGPTGTGQRMTAAERKMQAQYPLGIGGPEPVADACLYLARDSGRWISGTVLNVSGGRLRG
jgi:NAD(P)-dependent dehydrogenase (short-subunit alcohol dehydrogenase family)